MARGPSRGPKRIAVVRVRLAMDHPRAIADSDSLPLQACGPRYNARVNSFEDDKPVGSESASAPSGGADEAAASRERAPSLPEFPSWASEAAADPAIGAGSLDGIAGPPPNPLATPAPASDTVPPPEAAAGGGPTDDAPALDGGGDAGEGETRSVLSTL